MQFFKLALRFWTPESGWRGRLDFSKWTARVSFFGLGPVSEFLAREINSYTITAKGFSEKSASGDAFIQSVLSLRNSGSREATMSLQQWHKNGWLKQGVNRKGLEGREGWGEGLGMTFWGGSGLLGGSWKLPQLLG